MTIEVQLMHSRANSNRLRVTAMAAASAMLMPIAAQPLKASNNSTYTALSQDKLVSFVLDTARDGCIAAGDDPARLREYAEKWKWNPATSEMTEKFKGTSSKFLGGWTSQIYDQPFAIIQTEDARDQSRSCAITTTLESEQQYEALYSGWHGVMIPERHTDNLKPEKLSHIDAFRREDLTELVSTLSFNKGTRFSTLLITFAPPGHPKHPSKKGMKQWPAT